MLDQSFSVENFRKIYDIENRRGNNPYRFIETYKSKAIREEKKTLINNKKEILNSYKNKQINKELLNIKLEELQRKTTCIDQNLEEIVQSELNKIAKNKHNIQLSIEKTNLGDENKEIFTIKKSPYSFFVSKQLQSNLKQLYKIKPANKNLITEQLIAILSDNYPKKIFRLDVQRFYESIDSEKLLKELNDEHLLNSESKKILNQILNLYWQARGNKIGIPRGIGVSAYLAEIFMRRFDEDIKSHQSIVYYARYVDDIIIIATDEESFEYSNIEVVANKYKLCLSKEEHKKYIKTINPNDPDEGNRKFSFEYLGYKYDFDKKLNISISQKKFNNYLKKIDLAFYYFNSNFYKDLNSSTRTLLNRIKFLTTNTKLYNSKNKIMTGVFFCNKFLNDKTQLNNLDKYLSKKTNQLPRIKGFNIKDKFKECSFLSGFNDKKFNKVKLSEFKQILKIWKNL